MSSSDQVAGNPHASVSHCQIQNIFGVDLSAATVAKLLAAGTEEVDVAKQLSDAGLPRLPYHMQCERIVWKIFGAENKAAASAGRTAFAYVDITAKEVLPLWLPQDAIGGKSVFCSDWSQSDGPASTLAELGRALQAATTHRKVFRSFSQWTGAFLKYSAVAVAMKQMTTSRVFSYMNVTAKIYEEEKNNKGLCLVAILYDDVFKKSLANRAEAKDPELDMDDAFSKSDKTVLEACRVARRFHIASCSRATGCSGSNQQPGISSSKTDGCSRGCD